MGSSVSDLTEQFCGFSVEEGQSRFSRPGWFLQSEADLLCGLCGHRGTFVLRKHYLTKGGAYDGRVHHYWAIACGSCEDVTWLTDLPPELAKEYRKWDQKREFECPECENRSEDSYLVLANSRKLGAHCVAIVDPGGSWIRPVAANEGGALSNDQCWLAPERRTLRPLDVVKGEIGASAALAYQPEDRAVPDSWGLVSPQPPPGDIAAWLERTVNHSADFLVRGSAVRISKWHVVTQPLESSLALVKPDVSEWRVSGSKSGKRQVRVSFTLDGVVDEANDPIGFDLVVTDPKWGAFVASKAGKEPRRFTSEELGVASDTQMYLTLSLGEPFQGDHYKLVAAVIIP